MASYRRSNAAKAAAVRHKRRAKVRKAKFDGLAAFCWTNPNPPKSKPTNTRSGRLG